MPYDAFGVFTRSYNFTADKVALIKIQSLRMDGEFDNYATGMNQVTLRNGVVPFTGDVKMGGNKITGLAAGSAGVPSLSPAADATTGLFFPSAGELSVAVGGVEVARGTSTGLAIGALYVGGNGSPRTPLDMDGLASLRGVFEDVLLSVTGINGTVNVNAKTQGVIAFSSNAVGNWTFNVTGDSTPTTLDSIMGVGQSLTLAIEVPQGTTAYYCTAITVDGSAPSQLKWYGGAPTAGFISSINVYTITIIKTAAATFNVRASIITAN